MVVRLSVGIIRSVVEVECNIEEVDDLEVSLDCDVQSMSFCSVLFNMNNIKVSYSCMENMGAIISKHNKKILSNNNTNDNSDKLCNCRSQQNCPLDNKCLTTSLIYNAQVTSTTANQTTTKNYIGLTEGTFKQRYTQHKSTFTHRKLSNSTELSKYIWQLKDSNTSFTTKWSIIARARPYHNSSTRCDLCFAENFI